METLKGVIITLLVIGLIGVVWAIEEKFDNTNYMGYSLYNITEINSSYVNISNCADGQIWKVSGNSWICASDDTGVGDGIDTNASTACAANQVLDGDNNCIDIADFNISVNPFDQSLNTTDDVTFANITANWFNGNFNWTVTDDWNSFDGSILNFNESKLSSVYFNVTQSDIIAGTVDGGSLDDVGHSDGNYDGITFNFSESSGSPALDLRINFTGVDDFNRGVMIYRTSSLAGDYPIVQMWDYKDEKWEDYPPIGESDSFATMTQPVFDSSDHLFGGVAMMRIYKSSNGNTNNHYYVDWIAVIKGYGTPSGQEVDPYSIHRDGNITLTDNWDAGAYNITADYFLGNINATRVGNSTDYMFLNLTTGKVEFYLQGNKVGELDNSGDLKISGEYWEGTNFG